MMPSVCEGCGQAFHGDDDLWRHQSGDGCGLVQRQRELYDETLLSQKQARIRSLWEEGYVLDEVAELCGVERGTVKKHMQRIRDKEALAERTVEELRK